MAEGGNEAWVTLATNDSYALGALVLAQSLRRVGTTRALAVMVTSDVSSSMRATLSQLFDAVIDVNVLDSQDSVNLALLSRPDLGVTFTKLHCWRLMQYSKCVFLDADTLVIQNSDELFDREEFSAAPDSGWPDCFNSGVFVYRPNMDTYARLLNFALEIGSFDGGDQGLLNLFFKDWATSDIAKHLPFVYNMIASAIYSYAPAYKQFAQNVKIAHFIGAVKPWLQHFDGTTGQVRPQSGQEHQTDLLQAWWDIFRSEVHHRLTPEMTYGHEASVTELEQQGYFDPESTATATASQGTSYQPQPPSYPNPEPQSYTASHSHSHSDSGPPPNPEAPKPPPLLVAIYRHTPDYVLNPRPPPPPPEPESNPSPHNQQHSQSHTSNLPFNSNPSCEHGVGVGGSASRQPESEPGAKGIAGIYSKLTFDAASAAARSPEQVAYEEEMRRVAWEQGTMDYMGKDSFDNILKKIQASMVQQTRGKSPSPPKTEKAPEPAPAAPAPTPVPESTPVQQQPEAPVPVLESAPAQPGPEAAAAPSPQSEPTPAQEAPAAAPQPQPEQAAVPAPEGPQAAAPPAPEAAPVATAPPTAGDAPGKTAEEIEEELRAAERQAIEKKLAEQMRIAEQKLQEERAKAEAAAVAAPPQPSEVAVTRDPAAPVPEPQPPTAAAPPPQPQTAPAEQPPQAPEGAAAAASKPSAPPQQPKAPPRKQTSKDKASTSTWMLAGVVGAGVGLVAVALYAYFYNGASTPYQ